MLDKTRLYGERGYDWWWHHFTGYDDNGAECGFFLEFFVVNARMDTPAPQRYPSVPCYVMIKGGMWPAAGKRGKQMNRFFSVRDLRASGSELDLTIGTGIRVTEKRLTGSFECTEAGSRANLFSDRGTMRWDVSVEKTAVFDPGYAAGGLSRRLNLFDMFWYVAGMRARYNGWVEVDGQRYRVRPATSCGYQDKNWGRTFTSPWLWISSSCVRSERGAVIRGASLVLGGTRPTVYGAALFGSNHVLLRVLLPRRPPYEFNFTKPGYGGRVRWDVKRGGGKMRWSVDFERPGLHILVVVECPVKELLNLRYEDPWGRIEFPRLWNGGAGSGTLRINNELFYIHRCGCEYGDKTKRTVPPRV